MTFIISKEDVEDLLHAATYRAELSREEGLIQLFNNSSYLRTMLGRLVSLSANIHYLNGSVFSYPETIRDLSESLGANETGHAEYILNEMYLSIRQLMRHQVDIGWLYDVEIIDCWQRFDITLRNGPVCGFQVIPLISARVAEQYPDMVNIEKLIDWVEKRDY